MNDLIFSPASPELLDDICALYRDVTAHLNSMGIIQWDDEYPNREILSEDIASGSMYVSTMDGRLIAAYVLNDDSDIEYETGNWDTGSKSLILHRLCTHPDFQGQGFGRKSVLDAEKRARELGCDYLRLDAYEKNPISLGLYKSMGYRNAGSVTFRMGTFYLFEKKL